MVVSATPGLFTKPGWEAELEELDRDVLLVRGAFPFLRDLPSAAGAHPGSFGESPVSDGKIEYVDRSHRSSRRIVLGAANSDLSRFDLMCRSVEGLLVRAYQQKINSHARASRGTGYELLRYGPGDRFGEHVDAVPGMPELAGRILSLVAFCNEDFEGGDLVFPRQNLRIRPETGSAIIFPSTFSHPHEVEPVVSGTRYTVVTWFLA